MAHTDSHSCAHVNTSRAQARTNADDTALEQRIASLVNKSTAELVKVGHTPLPQLRGAAVVAHQRARTNTLTHVSTRAHACTPAHPIQHAHEHSHARVRARTRMHTRPSDTAHDFAGDVAA